MPTLDGVDLSSAQESSPIDFGKLSKVGLEFIAIKATGENGYVNPYFARDWAQAKTAAPVRIAYHFLDGRDPVAQADQFLAAVGPVGSGDVLALDSEANPSEGIPEFPPEHLLPWFQRVQSKTGKLPFSYMGAYYRQASDPRYQLYPLWLPAYTSLNSPHTVRPWMIWQYTPFGNVSGISSQVDENCVSDYQAFRALAGLSQPPTPSPEDPVSQFMGRNPLTNEIAMFTDGSFWRCPLNADEFNTWRQLKVEYRGNIAPIFFACTQKIAPSQ